MGPGFEPLTTHWVMTAQIINIPSTGDLYYVADLAQLVEHRSCKARVEGSSPLVGIMRI